MNQTQLRHALSKSWLQHPIRWWQHRLIQKQDMMLASYPRSGNTWLRFLLYECITGKTADFISINDPYSPVADYPNFHHAPTVTAVQGRIIKTHESFQLNYRRGIYLMRDPRAVVVSEFHYQQGYGLYGQSLDDFVRDFVSGKVNRYCAWHLHVQSWLDAPIEEILIIRYEDLKQNSCAVLGQMTKFLGLELTATEIEQIVIHNSVHKMQQSEKKNTAVFRFVDDSAKFVRKGQAHAWQSELTQKHVALIEHEMGSIMAQCGYDVGMPV